MYNKSSKANESKSPAPNETDYCVTFQENILGLQLCSNSKGFKCVVERCVSVWAKAKVIPGSQIIKINDEWINNDRFEDIEKSIRAASKSSPVILTFRIRKDLLPPPDAKQSFDIYDEEQPKSNLSTSECDESIIEQLMKFGYERNEILNAAKTVSDKNNINEIMAAIEASNDKAIPDEQKVHTKEADIGIATSSSSQRTAPLTKDDNKLNENEDECEEDEWEDEWEDVHSTVNRANKLNENEDECEDNWEEQRTCHHQGKDYNGASLYQYAPNQWHKRDNSDCIVM